MRRPELPALWRVALALAALLAATLVALDLALPEVPLFFQLYPLILLTSAITGGALLVSVARGGRRGVLAAGAALLSALALPFLSSDFFSLLLGLGLLAPVAVALARPHAVATPALLAAAAFFLGANWRVGQVRESSAAAREVASELHHAALLGLVLVYALAALAARTDHAAPRPSRSTRTRLVVAGTVLLALGYAIGGNLFFVPLWPLALALLALPVLAHWRAHATAAGIMGALLLAGLLPMATCTVDPWSDAIQIGVPPDADAYPDRKMLMQLGGHGPNWASGGGFTGQRVHCPAWGLALGVAWDVALVATAWRARPPKVAATG